MSDTSVDRFATRSSVLIAVRDPANHQAWEVFLARYGPMVRGWCRHWFPNAADDMAQEVFTTLVVRMRTFEYKPERGRFRGWLKTLTDNLISELKHRRGPLFLDAEVLDGLEAPEDFEARIAAMYDLELLEQAKEKVRGRVEEQTWSAYVETAERGRKPVEVARELGMKVGTVYQAKHSVLTALKREVEILEGSDSD
jgi:RNA polymerase sigma-70 factor (ECF subfamily)